MFVQPPLPLRGAPDGAGQVRRHTPPCRIHTVCIRRSLQGGLCVLVTYADTPLPVSTHSAYVSHRVSVVLQGGRALVSVATYSGGARDPRALQIGVVSDCTRAPTTAPLPVRYTLCVYMGGLTGRAVCVWKPSL